MINSFCKVHCTIINLRIHFSDDHIILSADDFQGFIPKQLLVRTVTADKTESSNSDSIKLPQALIQEITDGAAKNVTKDSPVKQPVKVFRQFSFVIK